MIRKSLLALIPAAVGLVIFSQWGDIRRYLKIKQLSQGQGHPENVPVEGVSRYPQHRGLRFGQPGRTEFTALTRPRTRWPAARRPEERPAISAPALRIRARRCKAGIARPALQGRRRWRQTKNRRRC
jgi:hypothetical protein